MAEHPVTRYLRMLEPEGWTYQEAPASASPWWKASYRTRRRKLEVYLCLNEEGLTFQAPIPVSLAPSCQAALWRYLLRLNNEIRLVKFTLDSADHIFLSAEVPLAASAGASFKDVSAVLTALRTYFEQFHREVELLASNRLLAEVWFSLFPQTEELPIQILSGGEKN